METEDGLKHWKELSDRVFTEIIEWRKGHPKAS
jgi:hypothetical protein